ncbi:MAG: MFS transporter [Sedimentisphaerales bacterium]|nr:MFS transporter [Sedimentisphaerales bacterium]
MNNRQPQHQPNLMPQRTTKTLQYTQLAVLTIVHALCDLNGGMIPALLPRLRQDFTLSLTQGIWLLAVLHITCNGVQLLIGHLRAHRETCFFIPIGLALALTMLFLGFLPKGLPGQVGLFALAAISAIGIAFLHPEALRAVHRLDAIPSSISSAIFLTGGFFGFAGGAYLTTTIVENFSIQALAYLAIIPAVSIPLIYILRIRIAVEPVLAPIPIQNNQDPTPRPAPTSKYNFWPIFFMAVPAAISGVMIVGLVPTRLNELDFPLSFGGFAVMLFGAGGAAGGLFWAFLARHKSEIPFCAITSLIGAPLMFAYFLLLKYQYAVALFCLSSFFINAVTTLAVSAARHARGLNIGQRMAFMLGGTWGTGSVLLLAVGPIADHIGTQPILYAAAVAYLISGIIALTILIRNRPPTNNRYR